MPQKLPSIISAATQKNWNRLNVQTPSEKLTTRANKRLSKKNIVPLEYAACSGSIEWVRSLIRESSEKSWAVGDIMYSLCRSLLEFHALWNLPQVSSAFSDLPEYHLIEELLHRSLPIGEHDILGLIYQSLLSEGERNLSGIYYTPPSILQDMTERLDGIPKAYIDPCCGSGAFLIELLKKGVPAQNLFGCDKDPIAVMLARTNLLIACGGSPAIPKVIHADFLSDALPFPDRFDLIITNPPWGAASSRESFSDFLYKSYERLSQNGVLRFLLPDSFLNIHSHAALRRHLLENTWISHIRLYEERFSGVTTQCLCAEVRHPCQKNGIRISGRGMDICLSAAEVLQDADCIFSLLDDTDKHIFQKVHAHGTQTLENSLWAMGIVTGDNKRHLKKEPCADFEPIYTGREVMPYCLKTPRCYIRYDHAAFQQSANEEFYRAEEKLVYKFISDRPVFALDTSKALCLNSANILIPRLGGLSIRTVMALLNSLLYQYMYIKQFSAVKILKSDLQRLPFPKLNAEENQTIDALVSDILSGSETADDALQTYIFELFSLTPNEITRITDITKGRSKS